MSRRIHPWILLLLVTALTLAAGLLRARLFLERPLWDDELWHRFIVKESSYSQILLWKYGEFHPPVSFFLNRLCFDLLGNDAAWVWRLPCFVCGLLCIPAAFYLGRKIDSNLLGLGVATLVAFDLNLSWESQNAHMYPIFALLMILVLAVLIPILKQPSASWQKWGSVGLLLAALIWTHVLALVVWASVALAAVLLLIFNWIRPDPDFQPRRILPGLSLAFAIALLLGFPGIYRFLTLHERIDGIAIPHRSIPEMLHIIYWVTSLLVWIEVRFATPLVFLLALAGVALLFVRCRAAALLLVSLGLLTFAAEIQILRSNPFTVMRYLIPLQPVLWGGIPCLLLCAPPRKLRPVFTAIFLTYAGVQAWNCTRLESTYGTVAVDIRESRLFVDAVNHVRSQKSPTAAITYLPYARFAYRGEYYRLPASDTLGPGPARPPAYPRIVKSETPLSFLSEKFDAPETWVIARSAGALQSPAEKEELQPVLESLAGHYHVAFDERDFAKRVNTGGWLAIQVSAAGFSYKEFR